MSQTFPILLTESLAFPHLEQALTEPNGLLAVGGDLSSDRLIEAYRHGIFPWFSEQDPLLWWSPCPRAIIPIEQLKVNKTLKKILRRKTFTVTINQHFDEVIKHCANAPFRSDETWILTPMIHAYCELHKQGYAHSIEVHKDGELVGGLYGVAISGFFSGESMFYRESNASKVALVALGQLLTSVGVDFIDCQILNPFLADMGCIEINRSDFVRLKQQALATSVAKETWIPREINLL